MICPACRHELPPDAVFCGYCGFRMVQIPPTEHRKLASSLQPLVVEESPLLLEKVKQVEADQVQELTRRANDPSDSSIPGVVDWEADTLPVGSGKGQEAVKLAAASLQASDVDHEQREYRRFPLAVEVGYASEHNFYTGFTENLSHGGLFVATHMLGSLGDVLALTFSVPGLGHMCTGICQVQWLREYNPDTPDIEPGMGLRFLKLEPQARAAIELFISHRQPMFYE